MREFLHSFQKLEFDKVKSYIQRYLTSDLGREHLEKLLPSADPDQVKQRLALVSEMKRLLEADDALPLEPFDDVRTSLHRSTIENYILPAEELRKIETVLRVSRGIHGYFSRRKENYPLLAPLVQRIRIEKILEFNITSAVDEEGIVKSSASKELAAIRRQIAAKSDSLRQNLQGILKTLVGKAWAQDDIVTTREGRMVIPVKVEHKNHVPGFIHSASASGATVFIEPAETLELNNEIRTLQFQERREIDKILKELTGLVCDARESILADLHVIGEIDFILAKAKYSIETIGSEPHVKRSGSVKFSGALHPILLQRHGRGGVVPLDMEMGDEVRTLIITGPNAGGKSVAMKSTGLLSLMAQAGCHIPASPDSEIRIFTDVFVDVGDEQSIEDDLSSFSSHLRNLKVILENANDSSLILIDEIGSGTDPAEGASLAAAVLERLAAIGATTIATTHHGALKSFAFENACIENGAMEFDQVSLRPTYRFRGGVPGSSYAIEMAERLEMPPEIINRSRTLNTSDANKLERLIIDLERRSQELKTRLEEASREKDRLGTLNQLYEEKITTLERELKAIKARALDEAQTIVSRAHAVVEKSIKEIKEKAAERQTVRAAREDIKRAEEELDAMQKTVAGPEEIAGELKPGDSVLLRGSNAHGEILSRTDKEHFLVLVGDMKVNALRKELVPDTARKPVQHRHYEPSEVQAEAKHEIDLRGLYGDEAVEAVDKFLDDAIMAGLHRVDIIHGKGTGALRRKITEYLKSNKTIKSFRLGEWNEGGSGVTVVELE